jgi:hypothetical protein
MSLGALAFITFVVLLFLLVGLVLILWPLLAACDARRTIYAITDQRLFIISKFPRRHVDSYAPTSIYALETVERANGDGDIVFHKEWKPPEVETGFLSVSVEFGSATEIGFFGISEVRKVEEAIQRLIRGVGSESPSPPT